jgi:hypothetical protein
MITKILNFFKNVKPIVLIVAVIVLIFLIPKAVGLFDDIIQRLSIYNDYQQLKTDYANVKKANANYQQNYVPIDSVYAYANEVTTTNQKIINNMAGQIDKLSGENDNLHRNIDSLKKIGFNQSGASIGQGTANITGKFIVDLNELLKLGLKKQVSDNWITLSLVMDSAKSKLGINYQNTYEFFDTEQEFQDQYGNQVSITSAFLRSKKDTTDKIQLKDYKVIKVAYKPGIKVWSWWNPKLCLDAIVLSPTSGVRGGLSFSFMSWQVGDQDKDVLLMLPSIGICSDFKGNTSLYAGPRINLGHFLPVIQDLHVFPAVGLDGSNLIKPIFLVGFGSTI